MPACEHLALFERVEARSGFQARICALIAGLSGFYMTHGLAAGDRFAEPSMWWMHAMMAVWSVFTFILFIAGPLVLCRWFYDRATRDPEGSFRLVWRMHVVLLSVGLLTVGAAVLGNHGALP